MFVDGASTLAFCEDGRLAALVGEVELALKEEGALVLIDDFSSLLWAGYDPQLLIDTFSYLREIIASVRPPLNAMQRNTDPLFSFSSFAIRAGYREAAH